LTVDVVVVEGIAEAVVEIVMAVDGAVVEIVMAVDGAVVRDEVVLTVEVEGGPEMEATTGGPNLDLTSKTRMPFHHYRERERQNL
jgi:hypothetical protein